MKQVAVEKQDYSWFNDLERAILRGFLCAGLENVPVGIIKETARDCIAHLPVEWGDELDMMFEEYCDQHPEGMSLGECAEFFYERGKQAGLSCTPVEWSEEDEKMLNLAIEWAETMSGQFNFVDMDSTDFRKIINWLKSLRPPMEAQR